MTGSIVHDIKNPIGVIQGFLMLAIGGGHVDEKGVYYLEKTQVETTRIQDMVCEILDFSRNEGVYIVISLEVIVHSTRRRI